MDRMNGMWRGIEKVWKGWTIVQKNYSQRIGGRYIQTEIPDTRVEVSLSKGVYSAESNDLTP